MKGNSQSYCLTLGHWWRARRGRLLQLWGVGVACTIIVSVASGLGYLESIQARALDVILRLQGQRFASDVAIVAIDDEAFATLGRRQPVSRPYLAQLLRAIQRSGAAAVALDIELTAPTTPSDDTLLAQAILDFSEDGLSRVVLAATMDDGDGLLSDRSLLRAVVRGSPVVPMDEDGTIRRASFLLSRGKDPPEPAFSLAVLARLAGMNQVTLENALGTTGGLLNLPVWRSNSSWDMSTVPPLPARPGELWRINYAGPAKSFLTIPSGAVAALGDPHPQVASDNPLRGRVVLVGSTFQESRDLYHTPHGLMSGLEVHANLIHMLATRSFIRPSGWVASLGIQLAVVLLSGVVLLLARPLIGTLTSVGTALIVGITGSFLVFHHVGYWVDYLLPVLATCLLGIGAEAQARRRLRNSFGRYVNPEVMAQILSDAPSLRGERREVTVLFSDLRGFATLSERLPPEIVAGLLNEYFAAMTTAIFAHRGMINDFVGDAIMAIFGAPVADPDHALHAVRAAETMQQALRNLNRRWEAAGFPILRMGIAIHTGEVFAGNVGGEKRIKYTVVGDAANAAARLEELNKDLGTTILMTNETRRVLGNSVEVKDHGLIPVKGRTQPLHVFEVLSVSSNGAPSRVTS
jgi:adenylate cyclase